MCKQRCDSERGGMNMRTRTRLIGVLLAMALAGQGACTMEDGWKAGLEDGISGAVAALIQAPVDQAIRNSFGGD